MVVGSANMDLVVRVARAPRAGETVVGEGFVMVPGGKGANQAVAAARLGAEVTFTARVGNDDFGKRNLENYRQEGIDTSHISLAQDVPSGVALIVVERDGENRIVVVPGANAHLCPEDILGAKEIFRRSAVLLVQLEIPLDTVEAALRLAREHGLLTILNPAPTRPLPTGILEEVDVLTPNETELFHLAGVGEVPPEALVEIARELLQRGPKYVVVTMGERGALLVSREREVHVPAFKVDPVDTTAAGDAFNAALAVSLAEGKGPYEAIGFANAAAALTVTRKGAASSLPTKAEVQDFLRHPYRYPARA